MTRCCHVAGWMLLLAVGCATAAERRASKLSTNVPLRQVSENVFELGTVQLDKSQRSVRFPAVVNMTTNFPVEYVVVFEKAKVHESIFRTAARAQDIHVAMLLLGAKPAMTRHFPEDLSIPPPGDKVVVEAAWTHGSTTVRKRVEDLILNTETEKPLSRGEWIYNGSSFSEGAFTAQRDGSIVSIHIDPDALINNPRPGRENDDLHIPNARELPPVNSPVHITIKLSGAEPAAGPSLNSRSTP